MEVHSVQEYLNIIEELERNYTYSENVGENPLLINAQMHTPHFIYRGHSDNKYELLPGVLRGIKVDAGHFVGAYSQLEHNILNDFIAEACRFIKDIPVDDIPAWLEIAQHFGVPTRLLDFTENPLVALYFACVGSPGKNACVWIINKPAYNQKFFYENAVVLSSRSRQNIAKIVADEIVYQDFQQQHYGNLNYIQWPWIYKPYYRKERMLLQESVFMLWGANRNPLTCFIDPSERMSIGPVANAEQGIMCGLKIPASVKNTILKQLNVCGISEKTIYPGLDGVGRYINKKYSSDIQQKEGNL